MSNPEYRNHYEHFQTSHQASWLGPYSGTQHIFLLHAPEAAGSCPCSQTGQLALREMLGEIKRPPIPHILPQCFSILATLSHKLWERQFANTHSWHRTEIKVTKLYSNTFTDSIYFFFYCIFCLVAIQWAVNSEIKTEAVVQNPLWEGKKKISEIPLWAQILGVEHSVGKSFHCAFAESGFGTATTAMSLILVVQYHGRKGPKTN